MSPHVRLALVVHNHQPIGNFDSVVERCYHDAYLPLVQTIGSFPKLRFALHLSGSLFDWLDERHPEFLDEVAALHRQQRLQILGGPYYEPILPMIPRRDRIAQIRRYGERLAKRFGEAPTGMWLPERVWEQQLVGDLAAAGIDHTLVDDFHFQKAGLPLDQLHGYYLTEDEGRLLALFPGSERLRYALPFAPPEETIEYLRGIAAAQPGATVVFADDGEKFGGWPGTKEHCHDHGWLRHFCELLSDQPWIETTTPADVVRDVAPLGKIYLPDGSYREMAEWSSLDRAPKDPSTQYAGNWRNFLVKYPEAGEMYARMQMVSDRVSRAEAAGYPPTIVDAAKEELYKAQCNCAYWHGSFAGVYLSHLRQAVYRHLIRADNILDRTADRPAHWVEAVVRDHNLDIRPEVCLASDRLLAFIAPHDGGSLYELDVRASARNVLATVAAPTADPHRRKSLIEHFYAERPTTETVADGRTVDIGDFAGGSYHFRVERKPDAATLLMWRTGRIGEQSVKLTKRIELAAGADCLTCEYAFENLPTDRAFHFGVEFNLTGFDDRPNSGLEHGERRTLDRLGQAWEANDLQALRLFDGPAGLNVGFHTSRQASWLAYPVRAVHRNEAGMETTHQATCVVPSWAVRGDAQGRWNVTLSLPIESLVVAPAERPDLGDAERLLIFPQAEIVTHSETVRGKPEVRRRTSRRLKTAS